MSSAVQIQHRPDVSAQKRSADPIEISNFSGEGEELKKELYTKVMNGEWDDVIKMYVENKDILQTAIFTNSKQTALHIAISNSKTDVVEKLLEIIDALEIQKMTDTREENPLHLAASLGQLETCKLLLHKDPGLIGARNVVGETPLFLAVLHGKNEAFYALHSKCCISNLDIKHHKAQCRRNDGDTILHVSIRGEYFQLAYRIINWYPELINDFNEVGQTALHLLAQNPSAFRSGCCLGPVDDFIYSCLIFDLDKVETPSDFMSKHRVDTACKVPENYQTCLDLLNLGKLIVSWARTCKIFSRNMDLLPVKNTIPGERQETSNRDPIQDDMSHNLKLCEHEHIDIYGAKTEPQMGSGDSTPPQYPSNYEVFLHFLQFAIELFLFVISLGYFQVHKIKVMKQKHKLTYQIMKKLVRNTKLWVYGGTGLRPDTRGGKESIFLPSNAPDDHFTEDQDEIRQDVSASTSNNPPRPDGIKAVDQCNSKSKDDLWTTRSPVLVAGQMGLVEMVKDVLCYIPVACHDEDSSKKNVLMLAAENGRAHVVNLLLKMYSRVHTIYQKVDNNGNTAIHLAATFNKNRPWRISSAAIQMQWDLKWYNFIKSSMPTNLWTVRNREGKTSMEVFEETHEGMIQNGVQWLNSTSQSCSVIAALIASVAYASTATVPGGYNQNNGIPIFKGDPSFDTFIIASLVALCFSVTSLTMFLSVLTSNYTIEDFLYNLPTKLLLGLTSLFISIGAMLVSFCAGHFFSLEDRNRNIGSSVFAIIFLPLCAYVLTQFHLLISLVKTPF